MAKHEIHISDREAANEFASLLARVPEGDEVIIEYAAGKTPGSRGEEGAEPICSHSGYGFGK